jgi:DNA-binding NarL/FixJ family response regulator
MAATRSLTKPTRIVLVEDHRILREGLRAIFAGESDLELAGEATDGLEAIQQVRDLHPDLLILDLSMPRMDGLAALKEIKRVAPKTRILVMTAHRNEEYIFRAIDDGADGYLLKDASATELLLAVRSVLAGDRYLSAAVATQVVAAFLHSRVGTEPSGERRSPLDTLSTREREVLKLVAEGYRSRQIGEFLSISEKTVEKHRANLMRKLSVNSASALTAFAIENGLVTR